MISLYLLIQGVQRAVGGFGNGSDPKEERHVRKPSETFKAPVYSCLFDPQFQLQPRSHPFNPHNLALPPEQVAEQQTKMIKTCVQCEDENQRDRAGNHGETPRVIVLLSCPECVEQD